MAPILAAIDQYLEDERLFGLVKADLSKHHPQTMQTGRDSTLVELFLRMLVVKQQYGYSYKETERYVVITWYSADSAGFIYTRYRMTPP